ncbi:fatty acid desaturase [Cyanobium sp. NIES-981]|uniref:fatty acid desaturase n=1 Tax=Cyanobium sp. NIES-981 TaxID=1851505 RepID=UPI0007DCEC72|nr:fatty acid desaturase [Cyanobium sp. NIES-981]SBO44440.1 Beta-carotene ketolase [Cyanobium sp. NIES-981]
MRPNPWCGPILAAWIILGWLVSLLAGLLQPLQQLSPALVVLSVLARTFLQTGLFIVGHDAIHGVLLPQHRRLNDRIGCFALGLYAALPYRQCRRNHRLHHLAPASPADPDVHPDPHAGVLTWYARFMAGYLSVRQMGALLSGWALLGLVASLVTPTAWLNVLVFCTLPLVLSSAQLFAFGTYLPHRGGRGRDGAHQVHSLRLPPWLSLLACYHFGYHHEHHAAPSLAWHELPRLAATPGWDRLPANLCNSPLSPACGLPLASTGDDKQGYAAHGHDG